MLISKCGRTLLQLVCLMPGLEGWVQRSSIAEHTAPYLDAPCDWFSTRTKPEYGYPVCFGQTRRSGRVDLNKTVW